MLGIAGEHFFLEGPVLVDLRRQLDEVAGHGGAADRTVVALGEQAMEGMAEFVEHGLHVVKAQQRGRVGRRFVEVAHVDDDRTHHLAVEGHVLIADVVHPGAAALAFTREVVGGQHADQRTVGIGHLEGFHVGVVFRGIFDLLEFQTVEFRSGVEDTFPHVLHLEIRFGDLLVEGIFGLADLLGVIEPVPRLDPGTFLDLAGLDVLVHDFLHVLDFLLRAGDGILEDVGQEGVDRLGCLGHLVAQDMGGGVLVAQQLGLFFLEFEDVEDDFLGVVLIAVVAAVRVGAEHGFALGAVFLGRHRVGVFRNGDAELGLEGVVLLEEEVAEAVAQGGEFGVDLLHSGLSRFVEGDAVVGEGAVDLVEHHFLLAGQSERSFLVVDGLDLVEERLVEGDVVLVLRHQVGGVLDDFFERRGVVGLGQVEQDTYDFGQQQAGLVVGGDYVVEGRRIRVGDDGRDFSVVLFDALFQGREIVGFLDLFEGRDAQRGVPLRKEGIRTGTRASCHSENCQCDCK